MFLTTTTVPDCIDDNSVADSEGDTCTSYYDLDNSVCGQYDTFDFRADQACCSCQPYKPISFIQSEKFNEKNFLDGEYYWASTQCRGEFLKGEEDFYEGEGKSQQIYHIQQKDGCYDKCVSWDDDYLYEFEDESFMCCEFIMMDSGRSACNLYHDGP